MSHPLMASSVYDYSSLGNGPFFITSYQADPYPFLMGLIEFDASKVVTDADQAATVIIITDAGYEALSDQFDYPSMILIPSSATTKSTHMAARLLTSSDWLILRDLERMFLSSHPLRLQREQWREQVDKDIAKDDER